MSFLGGTTESHRGHSRRFAWASNRAAMTRPPAQPMSRSAKELPRSQLSALRPWPLRRKIEFDVVIKILAWPSGQPERQNQLRVLKTHPDAGPALCTDEVIKSSVDLYSDWSLCSGGARYELEGHLDNVVSSHCIPPGRKLNFGQAASNALGAGARLIGRTGIRVRITQPARILSWRRFPHPRRLRTLTQRQFPYCSATIEGVSSKKEP
jgi:hypothetical protein